MKYFAWVVSLIVGFMSIGQEMLWFRILSFFWGGIPQAFAMVLVFFLLGITTGALIGKKICSNYKDNLLFIGGIILILVGIFDILTPRLIYLISQDLAPKMTLLVFAFFIFSSAALKAILFPIAHHLGTNVAKGRVGASVSKVYFFNIIGSTLGSLLIGGILLDYISISAMFVFIGITSVILGVLALLGRNLISISLVVGCGLFAMIFIDKSNHLIFQGLIETDNLGEFIENRYGIIHTIQGEHGLVVMGNNIYDGIININPDDDANGLNRVYLLAALHNNPKRILVIGLSGGAWTQVVSSFPDAKTIDVVELNNGYLELIARHPEVSPLLTDPRVHIHIDDGRRWLRRNSQQQYDLIVMNTTFHWRSGSTNLLSKEMMGFLKGSLSPGGILAFNSTRSRDTLKTASEVFNHAYWGSQGFIYASENELKLNADDAAARLSKLQLDNKPIFTAQNRDLLEGAYIKTMQTKLLSLQEIERDYHRPLEVITDSNMITEYKYGAFNQ